MFEIYFKTLQMNAYSAKWHIYFITCCKLKFLLVFFKLNLSVISTSNHL